jgi:hypothetical protein
MKDNSTEKEIKSYTYFANKVYGLDGETRLEGVNYLQGTRDRHFYNMEVNTSFSSVHVPTNLYHRGE